jgi:hypothetical protein
MAAYGYIVRKFIRNGEVIPDHFTGSTPQTMTVGTTLSLLSYEASAICSSEITLPDNTGVAATKFIVTVPYKVRVLSSSRFVAKTGTAGNLTVAIGKSTDGGTTVTAISSTTAAATAATGVANITTHVQTAETINPFATTPEVMVITVTKAVAANVADGTLYLNFVRAD